MEDTRSARIAKAHPASITTLMVIPEFPRTLTDPL